MNSKPNIATLILAAGNSSRMGDIKQLLPWKKTFLLNHAINNTVQLEHSKTIVVLGANYELIKLKLLHNDVEIIYNKDWQLGLGNSLAFGVKHIQNNYQVNGILIVLADQPLIDATYLNKLVNSSETGKNQIIVSNYDSDASEEKLGVPALFDACYFDELSELNEDKGAKKVILNHIEKVISLDAKHLIPDIDTKEDYERLYDANH